ncbi:MAG: zinc ribbon domain-containing protein [Oscillospiraceae bacterium]
MKNSAAAHSNSKLLGFPQQLWYTACEVVICMETKDVILELRSKNGLSQDELAGKVHVTRQAVSRWETGETVPNTETLKLLSKLFDVSINTLLGSPRKLICQCCGMPLDDASISREPDGTFNEEYCKWCYADGKFVYTSLEELTDFLVAHMANENWPPEQARSFFEAQLPKLNHWRQP